MYMKRLILLFMLPLLFSGKLSAAEIVISGNYYENNLFIVNPSVGDGFCITEVLVNGNRTQDEIRSNSFEIDLSQLNLAPGDPVKVQIRHQEGCTPTIINPTALTAQVDFSFVYAKFDRNGKLSWNIRGEAGEDPFIAEQFRWNKWVQVGEMEAGDTAKNLTWQMDVNLHFGLNQFRILKIDPNGNPVYSKVVKYNNTKGAEVTLNAIKVSDKIVFSTETMYEIFDQQGNYMMGGIAAEVDVSEIEKGKYFLNYDTKSVTITKK